GKMTTTTTGTGNLTLTAASNFPTFANIFSLEELFQYSILNSDAEPLEMGIGYLSASTTFVRSARWTFVSSTYDDTKPANVSLAAGTKTVIVTPVPGASMGKVLPSIGDEVANSGETHAFLQTVVNSNEAMGLNAIKLQPFYWPHSFTVGSAHVEVTTSGVAANLRLGLYNVDSAIGDPGHLLVEFTAATQIDASSTGIKTVTDFADIFINPGWYFAAFFTDVAHSLGSGDNGKIIGGCILGSNGNPLIRHDRSLTYAALPADLTGAALTQTSNFTDQLLMWLGAA
ncbi:hypothetical protein LCGC14_2831810, partial [marine sediment metagenome]